MDYAKEIANRLRNCDSLALVRLMEEAADLIEKQAAKLQKSEPMTRDEFCCGAPPLPESEVAWRYAMVLERFIGSDEEARAALDALYKLATPLPGEQRPYGDLRNAKWLDPECYEAGACQSLKFKAAAQQPAEPVVRPRPVVRYSDTCEVTARQRAALSPALYALGDAVLVWANEGDLCLHGEKLAAPPAPQPAKPVAWRQRVFRKDGSPYWSYTDGPIHGFDSEPLYLASPPAQQPAEPVALIGALARLWPLLDKATKDYVFTAERAGEVAADMNTIRAAIEAARAGGGK